MKLFFVLIFLNVNLSYSQKNINYVKDVYDHVFENGGEIYQSSKWKFNKKERYVIENIFVPINKDTFQTIYYFNLFGRKTKIETFEIENSKVNLTSSNLIVNNQIFIDTSFSEVNEWGKLIVDTVIQIYKLNKNSKYYYLKSRKDSIITIDTLYSMNKDKVHYSKSYIKNDPTLNKCFTLEDLEKEKNRYINPDCPQSEVIEVYNKNKDIQQIDQFSDGDLFCSERFVYDKQNRLIFKGQYYPTDTVIETVEYIQKIDTLFEIRIEQYQFTISKTFGLNRNYIKFTSDSIPMEFGKIQLDKKGRVLKTESTWVYQQTPINVTDFQADQVWIYSYPRKLFWCRELWK